MSGTDVERFLGASRALADRANLPTHAGRRQENFDASSIRKVVLGTMLAQVAVVPMDVRQVSLTGDGDVQMLAALRGRIEGGVLRLEGEIPFKPGSRNFGGGGVIFGDNVTIVSGSVFTSSSGGGGNTIIINNREVDLDRAIRLVLVVPQATDVKIGGLVGAVGITDHLDATLEFSPSIRAELFGRTVRSLIGDLSGSGRVTLEGVTEDAEMEVSGSGSFRLGSVGGNLRTRVSGSGNITVTGGTSKQLRASVSGSGRIRHGGVVTGNAHLRVSGSGEVEVARVQGDVDPSVTGSGSIVANGQSYRPRRW